MFSLLMSELLTKIRFDPLLFVFLDLFLVLFLVISFFFSAEHNIPKCFYKIIDIDGGLDCHNHTVPLCY